MFARSTAAPFPAMTQVLELKESIAEPVFEYLKIKESLLFVEFFNAGIKDVILPGKIRDSMISISMILKMSFN